MHTVRLGRTDLEVSAICFGTWQFGGDWGAQDERENADAIRRALDLGITFFDTAQGYGWGASEALLARALGDRRHDVVIATKGGLRMTDDGLRRDSSPAWLRRGVEESLRHLGVERIDLYQVHWPDPETPFAETAGALQELVDEGKIAHVGVSNFSAEQMAEFSRTRPVETLQPPYHLLNRDVEAGTLPWCQEHDVGVLVYGPLAHGVLAGKYDRDTTFPHDDWRASSPMFRGEAFRRNLEKVRDLGDFADQKGCSAGQLAVAWTLAQPAVDVAIVGARRPGHIEGMAGAADVELSADDLARIERIMRGVVAAPGPSPET